VRKDGPQAVSQGVRQSIFGYLLLMEKKSTSVDRSVVAALLPDHLWAIEIHDLHFHSLSFAFGRLCSPPFVQEVATLYFPLYFPGPIV
jgi:hypothetical protein